MLQQAQRLIMQNQPDLALEKLDAYIRLKPQDPDAYGLRGQIHVQKKQWDLAEDDFRSALLAHGNEAKLKFDLAELEFVQDKYAAARADFALLTQDPQFGDLSAYKVYLCDLYGGSEDVAARELSAFNQDDSRASYYFANAAACLFYHKSDEARGWLTSADNIFSDAKFHLYADSVAGRPMSGDSASTAAPAPEVPAR
jgi:Tfp pilus assembly protein PilF